MSLKKFLSLALVFVILTLCFCGCSTEATNESSSEPHNELLAYCNEVFDNFYSLTAYDLNFNGTADVKINGADYLIPIDITVKTDALEVSDPKMQFNCSFLIPNVYNVDVRQVLHGGYLYTYWDGAKSKVAYDRENAAALVSRHDFSQLRPTSSIKLERTNNGDETVINYIMRVNSDLLGFDALFNKKVTNTQVNCNISLHINKDNQIKSIDIETDYTAPVNGTPLNMKLNYNISVNGSGKEVQILPPDDADTYPETDNILAR